MLKFWALKGTHFGALRRVHEVFSKFMYLRGEDPLTTTPFERYTLKVINHTIVESLRTHFCKFVFQNLIYLVILYFFHN